VFLGIRLHPKTPDSLRLRLRNQACPDNFSATQLVGYCSNELSQRSSAWRIILFVFVIDVTLDRSESAKHGIVFHRSTSSLSSLTKKEFREDRTNQKFSSIRSRQSAPNGDEKKVKSSSSAEEEEEEEELPEIPFSRILALNKPEWYYMAGGERVLRNRQLKLSFMANKLYSVWLLLLYYVI